MGQQLVDAEKMLRGQHLGRRHDRRLMAGLDGDHGRIKGHGRLSRPDISLQEPVHRFGGRHVFGHLLHRPSLGASWLEWQPVDEPLGQLAFG